MENKFSRNTSLRAPLTSGLIVGGLSPSSRARLCQLAVAVGIAAGSSVSAYDFVTFTDIIPQTVTDWSFSHLLSKLTPADNPNNYALDPTFGIVISWTSTESSRFRFDNDDGAAHSIGISYSATLTLTVPGIPVGTTTLLISDSQTVGVTADNGDGVTFDFTSPDGFDTTLNGSNSGSYLVPFANHGDFIGANGSTISIPASATSTSAFAGSGVAQSIRNNSAGSTVTITYVLVPESNPLTAIVPGLALLAGLVTWRQRRAK